MTVLDEPAAANVAVEIGLNAAIAAMIAGEPQIRTVRPAGVRGGGAPALPFGLFTPLKHRTLEIGLRDWVKDQTGLDLGYVEQLYTFGDRGRHARPGDDGLHVVSIGYLALTRTEVSPLSEGVRWNAWYAHFPWEDWRNGKPAILAQEIEPRLEEWAGGRNRGVRRCGHCGAATVSGWHSDSRCRGTTSGCWSATSCFTRLASWRRRRATGGRRRRIGRSFRRSAGR